MKINKITVTKKAAHLLTVSCVALTLAGCSSVVKNNSALLLDAKPATSGIAVSQIKTLPGSRAVFAQTVQSSDQDIEEEELEDTAIETSDPREKLNRKFFAVNKGIDKVAIRPLSKAYGTVVPGPIRLVVRNALRHLETPGDLINYALQRNPKQFGTTFKRLVINSTLGLGGAFDVADHLGTAYNPTDFGLTLADWGVGEGNYHVTPFFGPTTTRDYAGRLVDIALSPQSYIGVFTNFNYGGLIARGVGAIDKRERNGELLDNIIFASPDPYVTLRSTYLQRRRALASGNVLGAEGMEEPLPVIATAGE